MEMWLKQGTDAIELPILPPSFEVTMENSHQTVNVQTTGEVTILGKKGLRSISLSSFFPVQDYAFSGYPKDREPYDYINKILGWQEKKVRLTITGTNINFLTDIQSFTYGEPDTIGDVAYTLSLQEYRPPTYTKPSKAKKKKTGSKAKDGAKKSASSKSSKSGKTKSKNYTIKQGDTLQSIAKKYYGSSSEWKKIYNANKAAIEKAAKKRGKTSSSNKGVKGWWIFPGEKLVMPT